MSALDVETGRMSAGGGLWAAVMVGLALAISYLLPRLAGMRIAQPDQDELPQGVRPRRQWTISGLSIIIALCLPLFLIGGNVPEIRAAAVLALLGGLAGLANDIIGLPRLLQAALAVGIAAVGVPLGITITELKPPFTTHMVALGAWRIPVTMAWMLAVTYAVVLCRRLPKLTAGLVTIIATTMAIAALAVGPSRSAPAAGLIGLTLAGAAAAASRRSYPSLGSSAHWAMGFTLAAITVAGMLKNTAFLVIGVPLLALGVPVGETTYAIVYGGRRGPRLAVGQRREWLHEALIRSGLSPRRTIALFYAATIYLCAVALLLVVVVHASFLIKLALLALFLAAGFVLFFMAARIAATPRETDEERVDMLGVPIARIDMEGALARVEQFIQERSPHMVVTSDGTSIVRAQEDAEYQEIVRGADMVTADGRGLVWMARVLGLPVKDRVSGVDMMDRLCALAAQRGYTVYLLGAQPGVAEEAARVMETRYPGLQVAGIQHGYFAAEEEPEVVARIAAVRPDILLVAFGAPRQEKWIRRHMEAARASVAIGVGGSFDVYAGRVERAPVWMQQAGLEWLWRAARDPKRIPRLWALPRLVFITLRAALTGRSRP
jgi:N-acetylglucosaminyldiphosphoundecaprenol N-acetyl-beta-D-mannosaminyltransferase